MEQNDTSIHRPSGIGAILRETRESQGMSVADVANRLKFAPRQITALEEEDFAQLPEIAFVRGFVRSYARLLQLDEAPLLAALPISQPQVAPQVERKSMEEPFPNIYALRKPNIMWLAGALVVAFAIGIFSWLHDSGPEDVHKPEVAAVDVPLAASAPESAVSETAPLIEAKVNETRTVEVPPPAVVVVEKPKAAAAPKPVTKKPVVANPVAASAVVPASSVAASGVAATHKSSSRAVLRMTFDVESWVEIKDMNGRVLLSRMHEPGSERILNSKPPFDISIGNASGVKLYYKGKQIDLTPYTDVSVAHLTLE